MPRTDCTECTGADQMTHGEIIARAFQAVAKVDLHGHRGLTLLSLDEIEALVLAVVILCKSPNMETPE